MRGGNLQKGKSYLLKRENEMFNAGGKEKRMVIAFFCEEGGRKERARGPLSTTFFSLSFLLRLPLFNKECFLRFLW